MKIIHVKNPKDEAHKTARILAFNSGECRAVEQVGSLPCYQIKTPDGTVLAKFSSFEFGHTTLGA